MQEFGVTRNVDLLPAGKDIPLTNTNKLIYVNAQAIDRMYTSVKQQMDAFISGFSEVVPIRFLASFTASDLELLLCGIQEICVDDWRVRLLSELYPREQEREREGEGIVVPIRYHSKPKV